MNETDISFLRRQAELCIALSRATFDLTVASRLRTMAEEFRDQRRRNGRTRSTHMPGARDGPATASYRQQHGPTARSVATA